MISFHPIYNFFYDHQTIQLLNYFSFEYNLSLVTTNELPKEEIATDHFVIILFNGFFSIVALFFYGRTLPIEILSDEFFLLVSMLERGFEVIVTSIDMLASSLLCN